MENKNTIRKFLDASIEKAQKIVRKISKLGPQTLATIGVAAVGVLVLFVIVTAAPPVSWIATTSTNCLAQGNGNKLVEVNGYVSTFCPAAPTRSSDTTLQRGTATHPILPTIPLLRDTERRWKKSTTTPSSE